MPKGPNQKLKLLALMQILEEQTDEQHPMTMQQLIDALAKRDIEAERKSIYDDLEALRVFGVDVETAGRRGYYVASRRFELPELKLLVDLVQTARFITRKKSGQLIAKLEGLASRHEAQQLQRQVYVMGRVKMDNESIYYNVDRIHAAISEGSKISFQYFEWAVCWSGRERVKRRLRRDGARYTVSPWALTWDNENYYLVGFDSGRGQIRHYRVDKMMDIEALGEPRDGQEAFERFDIAEYAKKVFGMFGGEQADVSLVFDNRLAGVVLERFGQDVIFQREDEGRFRIRVRVAVSPQFLSWLFGFGAQVRVVSPAWVREALAAQAREVLRQCETEDAR